ncbi:MAG: hypothetical protein IKG89_02675 [Oscillospiraceae bacterium]|nr:hypothetical protein [Oscillospiraceae bacterium]
MDRMRPYGQALQKPWIHGRLRIEKKAGFTEKSVNPVGGGKSMNCLRCGSPMRFLGSEQLQLGKTGFFTGIWSNIFSGALEVAIYRCANCGKLEFYDSSEETDQSGETPQRTCPKCGFEHDFDYPKCPKCGYDYYQDR